MNPAANSPSHSGNGKPDARGTSRRRHPALQRRAVRRRGREALAVAAGPVLPGPRLRLRAGAGPDPGRIRGLRVPEVARGPRRHAPPADPAAAADLQRQPAAGTPARPDAGVRHQQQRAPAHHDRAGHRGHGGRLPARIQQRGPDHGPARHRHQEGGGARLPAQTPRPARHVRGGPHPQGVRGRPVAGGVRRAAGGLPRDARRSGSRRRCRPDRHQQRRTSK